MKQLMLFALLAVSITSCNSLHNMVARDYSNSATAAGAAVDRTNPKFIESFATAPVSAAAYTLPENNGKEDLIVPVTKQYVLDNENAGSSSMIETSMMIQFKYAILLNENLEAMTNLTLLNAMEKWMGTRYCYGCTGKRGIDCSAFTRAVVGEVWNLPLERTARAQYAASQRISKEELNEGDLVFFNTRGGISHVGIYLRNNKFMHASSSSGVMISDLNDTYWAGRYRGAGRVLPTIEN
jgi:cell wall-associated NlpC family hydrolase